jgi:hypothetical protein
VLFPCFFDKSIFSCQLKFVNSEIKLFIQNDKNLEKDFYLKVFPNLLMKPENKSKLMKFNHTRQKITQKRIETEFKPFNCIKHELTLAEVRVRLRRYAYPDCYKDYRLRRSFDAPYLGESASNCADFTRVN